MVVRKPRFRYGARHDLCIRVKEPAPLSEGLPYNDKVKRQTVKKNTDPVLPADGFSEMNFGLSRNRSVRFNDGLSGHFALIIPKNATYQGKFVLTNFLF